MSHQSLWKATTQPPTFPRLNSDITVDILIIGGGITGITAAYLLHEAGVAVQLIEAAEIGSGDSSNTTAHLSTSTDLQYRSIRNSHDEATAWAAARAMRGAVDRIKAIAEAEGIDCNFTYEPGYLYAETEEHLSELEQEFAAAEGSPASPTWEEKTPLPFSVHKALRFDRNGKFHPLKFIYGLAQKLQVKGVPIYTHTRAKEMTHKDGQQHITTDNGHTIRARRVFVATHIPAFNKAEQSALVPSRTYAMAYTIEGEVPQGLFWDMQTPYHYTRNAEYGDSQVLITGGADHRTGEKRDTHECFRQLENYIRNHFPVREIVHQWSGQWYEPTDKLPLIGRSILHHDVYLSSGYSGDGMVWGVAGAAIVADLLSGKENELAEYFKPRRLPVSTDYLKNNATVARHLIGDRLPFDSSKVADIVAGEGKIVQDGMSKYAVYRDEQGNLTALSAVCTHMGCIVQWNKTENTWDCPCHGGQFSCTGQPLRAPVTLPLEKQSLEEVVDREEN